MKENSGKSKILNIIGSILYYVLLIVIILVLAVVLLQRVSNNSAAVGGIRVFNIVSESMVPKYVIGDVLVAKTIDPSEIKVGDDISYRGEVDSFKGKIVTHQVIAIEQENGEYKFHTKGIANTEEDPIVSQSQVYGKIIYHTKVLSLISKTINNLFGFYFLIFVPLTILILLKIRDIYLSIKEKKEYDEDDEEDGKSGEDKKE